MSVHFLYKEDQVVDKMDYVQMFDLKPEEQALHILICAKEGTEIQLPQAEFVDPKNLPHLSFSDQSFDLVLCPNVLFTGNSAHTEAFVRTALTELARVGSEVRVLPLVDKQGMPSHYLGSVLQGLQDQGMGVELRQVQTKAQGEAMLRLWNAACAVKA